MPNGIAIGGVTQTSAVLWAQSTATGTVTFQVATDVAFADVVKSASDAAADATIPVTVAVQDLLPGTALQMRVRNAAGASLTGRFRTNTATGKGARLGWTSWVQSKKATEDRADLALPVSYTHLTLPTNREV